MGKSLMERVRRARGKDEAVLLGGDAKRRLAIGTFCGVALVLSACTGGGESVIVDISHDDDDATTANENPTPLLTPVNGEATAQGSATGSTVAIDQGALDVFWLRIMGVPSDNETTAEANIRVNRQAREPQVGRGYLRAGRPAAVDHARRPFRVQFGNSGIGVNDVPEAKHFLLKRGELVRGFATELCVSRRPNTPEILRV
ncbi:MAG: hypothetical protein FWG25_01530 [Promicromonosporaceae bacterium]|nr:hypothetical protein [Promicromonosporaceae bacterium]